MAPCPAFKVDGLVSACYVSLSMLLFLPMPVAPGWLLWERCFEKLSRWELGRARLFFALSQHRVPFRDSNCPAVLRIALKSTLKSTHRQAHAYKQNTCAQAYTHSNIKIASWIKQKQGRQLLWHETFPWYHFKHTEKKTNLSALAVYFSLWTPALLSVHLFWFPPLISPSLF